MTIILIDYGGTDPNATYEAMATTALALRAEFGEEFVIALCKQIQESEVPEQSAIYQQMFRDFDSRYFDGQLPEYRVRVVYDVWYWETERCGYAPIFPPACQAQGFIDLPGRQIFMRYLAFASQGAVTMAGLLHEMAHAATDGGHDEHWQAEMARLKRLGAPVDDLDLQYGTRGGAVACGTPSAASPPDRRAADHHGCVLSTLLPGVHLVLWIKAQASQRHCSGRARRFGCTSGES